MKKAFTLAEIMIVLTIIGIITGILLPIAHQSLPDEKVMKFKKGHATLYKVINELVTSDKYYLDGDLGVKPDGSLVDSAGYLCETFSDILSTKSASCSWEGVASDSSPRGYFGISESADGGGFSDCVDNAKKWVDGTCKSFSANENGKIVTLDGITYWETNPYWHFGVTKGASGSAYYSTVCGLGGYGTRLYKYGDDCTLNATSNYRFYKIFCMDVDGINQGEDPFGYGIRVDGKILVGERAQQWLERDIQDKD